VFNITDPDALLADLAKIPQITASTARTTGFGLLANGERSFAAAVIGIDPEQDPKVATISTLVKKGRTLTPDDDQAIILGAGLARNLRLELGDPVTLLGSGMDGSVAADVLMLVGIFESNVPEIDRQIAQMPLSRFQDSFLMEGSANIVALKGETLPDIIGIEDKLLEIAEKHGVVYLGWEALAPDIKQALDLDKSTSLLMYVTLVVVVVFVILNTLYMSVLERTREFGVLLAIGMKPGQIGRMVWLEMVFLSFAGNGLGIALGLALTYYFQLYGIAFEGLDEIYEQWGLPSRFYPAMTPFRVLAGPGAVVAIIALLGIIPYRRTLGLEPVSAMADR